MKKAQQTDLTTLTAILEDFVEDLESMSEPDLIDLAARLKPTAKACKTIDDHVKKVVRTKLKHKEGTRLGGMFKALLKLVPVERFQAAEFKEADFVTYSKYLRDDVDERISFEVR
jgi:hypothetical protein